MQYNNIITQIGLTRYRSEAEEAALKIANELLKNGKAAEARNEALEGEVWDIFAPKLEKWEAAKRQLRRDFKIQSNSNLTREELIRKGQISGRTKPIKARSTNQGEFDFAA